MLSYKIIFKKAIYCYFFPLSKTMCKKKKKTFKQLFYIVLEFGKGEELNTWLMSVFNSLFSYPICVAVCEMIQRRNCSQMAVSMVNDSQAATQNMLSVWRPE